MKPYIVVGSILYNEERLIKYSLGALYKHVDEFVIIDHYSTDKTIDIIKSIDIDNKVTIIKRKWDNSYKNARNLYLKYIKNNIWPKHKQNLYYIRNDADEVHFDKWLIDLKKQITENPEIEAFRGNFYCFSQDYNHLDTKNPTESRVSVFKYSPDIEYINDIHEILIHKTTGIPCHASILDDKALGIMYLPGYQYNHYAWCGDIKREFNKAVNYEKHYVNQGKSTIDKLNSMKPDKNSWWFDKESNIKYNGELPSIFNTLGLLDGQENPNIERDKKPKFSVYTLIKNAIKFDYPIIEAINSVLPIADEVIINCGDSEDGTTGLIHKAFDGFEKVKIFERKWDGRDKGTLFLRKESNWAKEQCSNNIVMYLQSDEVYHEDDYIKILDAVKVLEERHDLLGAKFKWRHLDGDYGTCNPTSYPEEVRLIKKNALESIGDAQSMGISQREDKLNVMAIPELLLETDIRVFHTGWAREPKKMLDKLRSFDLFYHNDIEWHEMHKNDRETHKDGKYNYGTRDKHLKLEETMPVILYPRVQRFERENKDIIKNYAKFNI